MNKAILIGDQHYGCRSDSPTFHEHFRKFYSEVFFPYVDENGIKTIFGLGDFFDKRKHITFTTLKLAREIWFDEIKKRGIEHHMIVGNHDSHFKNTIDVNAPDLLLNDYDNIHIYDSPTDIQVGSFQITMMPWICPENYDECMSHIKNTRSQVLFGHLELDGFKMYKNSVSHGGMKKEIFDKFKIVRTGHFHHKNGYYLGAPMEYNWSDHDDPRGFHVMDMDSGDMEYIQNPYKIHHIINYSDDSEVEDYSHMKNCFVKILVGDKKDHIRFEKFIEHIETVGMADYQILENKVRVDLEEITIEDGVEDTITTLQNAANQLEDRKEEVSRLLLDLYSKSMEQKV